MSTHRASSHSTTRPAPSRRVVPAGVGRGATWRWLGLSSLVGVVAGVAAIAFYYASALLFEWLLHGVAGYWVGMPQHAPAVWFAQPVPATVAGLSLLLLLVLPAAGNALANLLKGRFAPDRVGFGNDSVVDAYHRRPAPMRLRVPFVNLLASALTLGSGGSGGREGPIAQISAGLGQWLGERLGLSAEERRVLLAAGMAAGIGAVFRAPLAAALFAAEILYRGNDVEADVLTPSIIASVVGYTLFSVVTGDFNPLFSLGDAALFTFANPLELLTYTLIGLVVAAAGRFNVFLYRRLAAVNARFDKVPQCLRAGLGGLLTGATAVALFLLVGALFAGHGALEAAQLAVLNVLSFGYGLIQGLINPDYAAHVGLLGADAPALILTPVLLLIAGGKMFATGFTVQFGGAAGTFGPSLVIGGCIGGALGAVFIWLEALLPGTVAFAPSLGACVIVGMAAYFAAIAKTPISSVIMVAELTSSYGLLIPAIWTCTLAYLLLGPQRGVLFPSQPETRIDSLAHRGDFVIDVFKDLHVRDIAERRVEPGTPIPQEWSLAKVLPKVLESQESYFPVVDDVHCLVGIVSINDIREALYADSGEKSLHKLVTAGDIATTTVAALHLDDTLNNALARFTAERWEALPVVEPNAAGEPKLRGMLSRRALLTEYTERLHILKSDESGATAIVRHPKSGRRTLKLPSK